MLIDFSKIIRSYSFCIDVIPYICINHIVCNTIEARQNTSNLHVKFTVSNVSQYISKENAIVVADYL